MKLNPILLVLLSLPFFFLTTSASPTSQIIEGHTFNQVKRINGASLELKGTGLARYKYVFKICVGGLYLPKEKTVNQVLAPGVKQLELIYLRDIEGKHLIAAGDAFFRRNVQNSTVYDKAREQLNRLYPSVKKGDRLALTAFPGQGLILSQNGRELGRIPGDDFARKYLSVWFGDDPASPGMLKEIRNGITK